MDEGITFKAQTETKKGKSLPKELKKRHESYRPHQRSMFEKMLIED